MKERREIVSDIEKIINELEGKLKKNKNILQSNEISYIIVKYPNASERAHSQEFESEFGIKINRFAYYGVRNNSKLSNEKIRTAINKIASEMSEILYQCIFEQNSVEELEKKYLKIKNYSTDVKLSLYFFSDQVKEWKNKKIKETLLFMNDSFAIEVFESLIEYVKVDLSSDISDYEKEILRLESEKNRANNLIAKLQDEFDERLDESKKEEQEKLIQELNSSRYDYILDKAVALQNGLKQLRREHIIVPIQINSVSSLVREVIQFAEDCGITPMLEIGEELDITGGETEYYQYNGSPFNSISQKKKVIVTSTGWEIKEKNIIISQPIVKEIDLNDKDSQDGANESINARNLPVKEANRKIFNPESKNNTVSIRNKRSLIEKIGDYCIFRCEKEGICRIDDIAKEFGNLDDRSVISRVLRLRKEELIEYEDGAEELKWIGKLEDWKQFVEIYNKNLAEKNRNEQFKIKKKGAKK